MRTALQEMKRSGVRAGRRNVTARLPRVGTWRFWLFEQAVLAICRTTSRCS